VFVPISCPFPQQRLQTIVLPRSLTRPVPLQREQTTVPLWGAGALKIENRFPNATFYSFDA